MPLRILITGTTGDAMPPPYGGIPKVSLLYARAWRTMGHKVGVTFVYKPENADDHGANAEYFFEYKGKPNKQKKVLFLIQYFFKNPLLYLSLLTSYLKLYPHLSVETILYSAYGVHLDKVFSEFKPDIVMSQAVLIKTFMASKIAKRHNIPIVYVTYVEIFNLRMGLNKDLNEEERDKYWRDFLSMPQSVITISRSPLGVLKYLPKEKIKVFYDTCDFNAYQVNIPETKEELRDSMELPQDMFLAGMVGAFHYRKGHHHLIEAIGMLNRQGYKNIGAVICGGTRNAEKDLKKWKTLAKEEGVEDKIFFFSNFGETQLTRLHKSLDIYCNLSYTTRSCGLDLALLEAMASGLPIVVYDNAELSDAVSGEENGFLIKNEDIKGVASAILKMYKLSPSERNKMGTKSRALAAKTDINITAKIKLGWFEEIIQKFTE